MSTIPAELRTSLDSSNHLDMALGVVVLSAPHPPRDEFRCCPSTPLETLFRHSGWLPRRAAIWASLLRTGTTQARLDRFATCGSAAYVAVGEDSGALRITSNHCRDRQCVACGVERAARVARSLENECRGKDVRFVTLTLRHSRTPLSAQIDRIYQSLRMLRRRAWWRARVDSGVALLEVHLGRDGMWHVHLHCLIEGRYLPQRDLGEEWHAVTGDSYIVDVRQTNDRTVRYVCKYIGKPVASGVCACPQKLDEAVLAMRGRRLILAWGGWAKLDLDASDVPPERWIPLGSLQQLLDDARRGDRHAMIIIGILDGDAQSRAERGSG